MESLGVDEVYIDRMSGKNAGRPELRRMLEYVRRGDSPMKGRMPDDRAIAAGALDAFLTWFIQRYQQEEDYLRRLYEKAAAEGRLDRLKTGLFCLRWAFDCFLLLCAGCGGTG